MSQETDPLAAGSRLVLEGMGRVGGRAMIYTGHRRASFSDERETAWVNAITEHQLRWYGLVERAASNRPGRWFRLTDLGWEAVRTKRRPRYGRMENLRLGEEHCM